MASKNRSKGILLALSAAIFWALSGTSVQFLFEHRNVGPEWLVTIRLLSAGILLLLIARIRQASAIADARISDVWGIWKNRKDATQLLLFSILGMLGVQYTYFAAISYSNTATATILQFGAPVMIAVYLAFTNRKWPRPAEFLAILLAIAGTFLLVTHGSFHSLSISGWALFWGLGSSVAVAFYSIQPARLLHRYSATIVIGWSMVVGGIAFGTFFHPWKVTGIWDGYAWLALSFVIIPGSLMAFYAYLTAVKLIGAQTTSLLISAEPMTAAIVSVCWLNVPFTGMDWLGGLLILSTIFLLTRKNPQTPPAATQTADA